MAYSKQERQQWTRDKIQSVGDSIVRQFQSGDLPETLAPMFLNAGARVSDRLEGWTNRLLVAMSGYSDAATYRQWLDRGRQVRKGEKQNLYLFRPMTFKKTNPADPDDVKSFVRFTIFGVFGLEQTDIVDADKWAKFAPDETKVCDILEHLPMRDVADAWGINVGSYSGRPGQALGYYVPGRNVIKIGVADVATWAHELIHAADDKLGKLSTSARRSAEYADGEIVAELGGCILLTILGYERGADRGGAFKYVTAWSRGQKPVAACKRMLNRTCSAVNLILETAKELGGAVVA